MKSLPYLAAAGLIVLILILAEQTMTRRDTADQRGADAARSMFLEKWNQIQMREHRNAELTEACRQSSNADDRLAYTRWVAIRKTLNEIAAQSTIPAGAGDKLEIATIALQELQFPATRSAPKSVIVIAAPEWNPTP